MARKINDGDMTGIKQDKYRNSRFEYDQDPNYRNEGVSVKSANTLGGPFAENRGRRSAALMNSRWDNSPFENGRLYNWKRRTGWDEFYDYSHMRGSRNHGGALLGHDPGHIGKGPKGYSRSDDSIFHDVCDTLSLSPDVDASDLEVTVKQGVVYLSGTVANRRMKKMAEIEIENVSGVQDVQNLLTFQATNRDLH
jgi:osmotically-inducible protein OsmY